MKALSIAAVNLRRLFRRRSNIFFVFVLPMMLILLLGTVFGGSSKPKLGVTVGDSGSLAAGLYASLQAEVGIDTVVYDGPEALIDAVQRGKVSAGLVIPAGYDEAIQAGQNVTLEYYGRPDSYAGQLGSSVDAAVGAQSEVLRAARFASSEGAGTFQQMLPLAGAAADRTVGVTVQTFSEGAKETSDVGSFEYGASTELLLFVFLTSMTGGIALIETRLLGVSRRMISTPTSITTILAGEALGRFAVALLQGVFIMIGATVLFGVQWGSLPGAILVIVLFCLVGTGASMLFASVLSNAQQAIGIALLFGLGMAAFGGSMAPLDVFPPTLRMISHVTPHAWGNEAFEALIGGGATIVDILPKLGILALYAAVLLALATWRFRKTLTT